MLGTYDTIIYKALALKTKTKTHGTVNEREGWGEGERSMREPYKMNRVFSQSKSEGHQTQSWEGHFREINEIQIGI